MRLFLQSLLAISLAAGLLDGAEIRGMEAWQVDPLTESWRWQRVEGLEGRQIEITRMAPDGRLGTIQGQNDLQFYNGIGWERVEGPAGIGTLPVNAFFISSRGNYCVVTNRAVYLHDGTAWIQVADGGIGRRVWDGIIETADGVLWIGLNRGVARLDPATAECVVTPWPVPVLSLCEGPDRQSLWIATAPRGEVWECPLQDGRLAPADEWVRRKGELRHEILANSLMRASDGRIWHINNNHNLPASVFDPATAEWTEVNLSRLGGDNFDFSILETPDGAIWVSSRGSLHVLKDGKWTIYHSPEHPLPGARSSMIQDAAGAVTIVEAGGMNVRIDYGQRGGLSFNGLHFQDESPAGDLLFISIADEVVEWREGAAEARFHSAQETGIAHPGALIVHRNGDWILAGSTDREAAVSVYDGERWQVHRFPEVALSFGHLALLERPDGEVWLGCAQLPEEFPGYAGGIIVLSPEPCGGYSERRLAPPAFRFRNWSLVAGQAGGVFTSGNDLFENIPDRAVPVPLPEEIQQKWIDQAAVDAAGDLWCAVWSFGIYRLHAGEWRRFTEADGLDSALTSFITCLDGQDPVATTRSGHFRFDGQIWAPFMSHVEGLHRGSGRVTQAGDGSIWINHTHVDWYYRGQRTEAYSEDKKRGFRTVQYVPDHNPPDTQWAAPPSELQRNTNLRFRWKGLDAWSRTPSDQLQFSHRIDDGPWSPFGPADELDLDQMKGGRHTIEVRSRDGDFNIDPTPLRAEFTVILPLWQQAWFIAALAAGLLFLIAVVVLFIRQRVKHLLEIEQVKMRFFTHLSHEIKTPLSLILGPVERLQNEVTDSRHQHYLSLIKSNSQRLLFLINQLLDFRKFQLNKLDFKPQEGDFIPFARSCLAVFEGWVREKGHTLALETGLDEFVFPFDQELFHKIIDNLVNNAVKYTAPGGRITVRVARAGTPGREPMGRVEVEDNGPGVRESEQEAIFEPFYRSAAHDQIEAGSGIGLAFVKELVDAIGGAITVRSPVNAGDPARPGSCFSVSFPLNLQAAPQPLAPARPAPHPAAAGHAESPERSVVLLIEDNRDLREFIRSELSEAFAIEAAMNADEGLPRAREMIPDIVISDVVMPGRNGFEVCRELKRDPHTSHIPVILLTALRSEDHKLQAYQSGADDFITKPVSPEILRLKVRNLLATQRRAREQVRRQFVDDARISGLSEADQAFIDKASQLVDQHLANEQFDVNALAEKMGFSRSAFYRKFNSLTDLSPASFIRTKRLRQAALWLAEGSKTVSEIAYDVGFSDAGYFSRVFKDEYKCSPSEFARGKQG